MRNPTAIIERCTAQRRNGEFCDLPSLVDMPFPICKQHAEQVHRRMAEHDAEGVHLMRDTLAALRAPDPDEHERAKRREAAYAAQSQVYYVRIGDHVKIGTTINMTARMAQLRVDPDAVLATEPGDYKLERERHIQFAAERVGRRENFNPSRRLLAHIEQVRAEHGEPNITGYLRVA